MRTFLLAACALCCARGVAAQEPCRIERAAAPDYGGVMLGMRLEELRRMFPGSEELRAGPRPDADAAKPFVVSLGMLELGVRREEFRGVAELVLTFVGGVVRRIDVRFRQPVPWADVTEFSQHVSKRLALPADSWGTPAADGAEQSRVLGCRGFGVVAHMDRNGPSTLSIVDTAAQKADARTAPPAAPARTPRAPKSKRPRGRQANVKAPAKKTD